MKWARKLPRLKGIIKVNITACRPRVLGKKKTIDGVLYDFRGYLTSFCTTTRFNARLRPGWVKLAHRKGAINGK